MLLEIKKLHAGYGELEVLRGIELQMNEGEAIALIGPNGAGKSTVLKSIAGLTTKTSGRIFWNPSYANAGEEKKVKDITNLPTHALLEEGIGFVPQGRLVFPSLTVKENLEMGGYLLKRKEALAENMGRVFSLFPVLKKYLNAKAGSLSGGEQQMCAIGRALMMAPKLLMLDEPSLGLAPKTVEEMYEKLSELNASGTALLIVEQNVRLVLRYVSRGYLLSNGSVRYSGTASELGDEKLMREAFLI